MRWCASTGMHRLRNRNGLIIITDLERPAGGSAEPIAGDCYRQMRAFGALSMCTARRNGNPRSKLGGFMTRLSYLPGQ